MRSPSRQVAAGPGVRPRTLPRHLAALILIAILSVTGCAAAPSSTAPAPGEYTVAVSLSGGSGKASVKSPAKLMVTADKMTAQLVWSSPNYTWVEVDGTRYRPTSGPGENSTFEIPVELDVDIKIRAETVAMSRPHTIEYTLRLDASTIKAA